MVENGRTMAVALVRATMGVGMEARARARRARADMVGGANAVLGGSGVVDLSEGMVEGVGATAKGRAELV